MKSVYDFIVKPIGDRYANTKKIGDTELVLNTTIEGWKFVNRFAEEVSTPLAIATPVRQGDIVVIHQNIFRRFYNMQGKQTNSRSFLKMICILQVLTKCTCIKEKINGDL